jgi:hypothetical protein
MANVHLFRNVYEGFEILIDPNVSDEELIHQLRTQGLYVSIVGVQGRQVKVAVEAPDGIRVLREEHVTLEDRVSP